MKPTRTIGIVGGSGLYNMEGLEEVHEHQVHTTFGEPSDTLVSGMLGDNRLIFLPRHGRGHRIPPHQINYRANILALKQLGAEQIVSISAVGSMKEEHKPGDIVFVDQFIDRTRSRPSTFFEDCGVVVHVEFADPVDSDMQAAFVKAAQELNIAHHKGGTYVCVEGPQFSTRAESTLYRSWGVNVIGMTNLPEARLAREAELPYATMALVTDYDCWHQSEESVSVEAVIAVLQSNVEKAQRILKAALPHLPQRDRIGEKYSIKTSILSDLSKIPAESRKKLAPLIANYLD